MRKRFFQRCCIPFIMLSLISACIPNLPKPVPPTQDPTLVAIAAEATVNAITTAKTPTATPANAQAPTAPAITATAAPKASDFWVVYISKNKLATINGDGQKRALLTNTPGLDSLPTWSPDGKNLAFLRFDGSSHTDGMLHLLPAGANTPRILDAANVYNSFSWTSDSQKILAPRGYSGNYEVYLLYLSGSLPFQVAKGVSETPRLSPDGRQIALLVNTGQPCDGKGCVMPNDLFLYDIATRQTKRLTGDALPKVNITWAPDGSQIAYFLATGDNHLVEMVQTDGKIAASKANPPWWKENWLRSPDGAQIAYFINDTSSGGVELFTRPGNGGGEPRRVTRVEKNSNTVAYIDTLRWRPDGSGLVFNTWTGLYTVNLDGSGLRGLPVTLDNVFFDVRPVADSYIPAPEPTPPAAWKICPGGLDTRLDVGRQAQVTLDPPTPNNVRQGPSRVSRLMGQIQPGEKVEITGGPICNKGMIWWEIQSLSSGLKGYTLEGDLETYWLVPVQ